MVISLTVSRHIYEENPSGFDEGASEQPPSYHQRLFDALDIDNL